MAKKFFVYGYPSAFISYRKTIVNMRMEFLHPAICTIMTLISPGDCTLQCGMWLWEHDSEFSKWQHPATRYVALRRHAIKFPRLQHPAMWHWHVALGSWHWIRQVAMWLCDDMSLNSPKRPPYWNSTSGCDFDHITAVDIPFCTSLRNFIQIGQPSAEKNDVMSFFRMGDLSHLGF